MHSLLSKYLFYYPVTLLKGEAIAKYLSEYERFQHLPTQDILSYQLLHLNRLLSHAYSKSSYYKESFDSQGVNISEIQTLDDLSKLPFLSKSDLSSRLCDITTVNKSFFTSVKTTGGSTGQAVTLLKDSDALARERAATWRCYRWAGVGIGDSQARFWGTPLNTGQQLKYKLIDFVANRKIFSAFDINNERLELFYNQLVEFKPAYLYGYVSIIEIFSKFIRSNNYELPSSVKCVITTSEVLSEKTRNLIERSLKTRVFNEYGCGEVGSIAHECEQGNMHVMEDNLIFEIMADSKDSSDGEIVVTDLFNYATPLIRYRLGDYASLGLKTCSCGRSLKTIGSIHGRAYDCIYTEGGKSFHPEIVMYIFEGIKDRMGGIEQFQVVQKKIDHLSVRVVKGAGYGVMVENYIVDEVRSRLHPDMKVLFEYVDEIKRESSGKLRLVKSDVLAPSYD